MRFTMLFAWHCGEEGNRESLGNIQARACSGRAGCDVLPMAPYICAVAIRERCLCAVRLQRADALCQMCSETPLTVVAFSPENFALNPLLPCGSP